MRVTFAPFSLGFNESMGSGLEPERKRGARPSGSVSRSFPLAVDDIGSGASLESATEES